MEYVIQTDRMKEQVTHPGKSMHSLLLNYKKHQYYKEVS